MILFKRTFRYFLPRIMTIYRYKFSRPILTNRSTNLRRGVSVFSPFMALTFGHLITQKENDTMSLADVYAECSRSVVHLRLEIKADDELHGGKRLISNGSGFIIREDGLILTNAHVVCDMSIKSKLNIRYYDGRVVKGQVVCVDPLSDLAIVKPLEDQQKIALDYPVVKFTNEKDLRVGDRVFAVGSPFGLLNTMSAGVVSGLDRSSQDLSSTLTTTKDSRVLYLQTDLHLFPGNSGGPIFDTQGRVIGISTVRSEAEGLSLAIQINNSVQRIMDQMIASGRVRRAWLGFRGVSLNPEIVEQIDNVSKQTELNSIKHGVLVLKAYDDSPAVAANLMPGDVIVAVNDRPVKDISELLTVLDESPIDATTKLSVKRILLPKNSTSTSHSCKIISITCQIKPDEYDIFTHKDQPYN